MAEPLPDALRQVVREIDRRLAQESDHAQAVRLMTAAFKEPGRQAEVRSRLEVEVHDFGNWLAEAEGHVSGGGQG